MSKSAMILFPRELKNIKFKGIYEAIIEDNTVYINAYVNEFNLSDRWVTIGRYNIDNKEGKILLGGYKDYKWYKNLKSLWNAIWKFDSNACMTDIDAIKNKIKEIQKQTTTKNVEIATTIEVINTIDTVENNTVTSEPTNKTEKTSHDILQEIYKIDPKIDALTDEYDSIQSNRKQKGLSLAIYKCNDPEALQLIEIDNKIKELEDLQDELLLQRKEVATQEYHSHVDDLIKFYGDKKYKVKIENSNSNQIIFTDNFHEVIDEYKKLTDNNKIKIKVFKLLYLNHKKYLPDEILIYNRFMNQWNFMEENRYYYNNNGYLLEKQLYYNNTLINKFIYRGYSDISAYIYKTNKEQPEYNMFAHVNNIKQNFGVEMYKENDNIKYYTNTNIALGLYVRELTCEGQELLNKIQHRYSKDKYININELIAV